jgi:hypothetical protein
MIRLFIGMVLGAALVLVVHSKMDHKTEADLNKTIGTQVDAVGTVALDGVQAGLNKANAAITDGPHVCFLLRNRFIVSCLTWRSVN